MSFNWQAPEAKKKAQGKPADTASVTAKAVAAGGVEVDAIISKMSTMCDGGTRLILDLPELKPEMFALLYALRAKAIRIVIK